MFDKLAAEFPRESVSWRAQSVTKDGTKAMALAYIDARDVMERLDRVCGPGNWQDRYDFAGPRTICYLSIKIGDEWITKADGAGDTAVEAEKGAISDAFKRAAVKWGIGRYLYALDAPWVPCECSEFNGKKQWRKWKADPWQFVKGAPANAGAASNEPAVSEESRNRFVAECEQHINSILTEQSLRDWWSSSEQKDARRDFELSPEDIDYLSGLAKRRIEEINAKQKDAA